MLRHAAVQEVAGIGIPHERWGEVPEAFVVLRSGASVSEGELREFARETLAHSKVPHRFTFIEELPKTATGKIQKYMLRQGRPAISAV
jgi:fatty-acyl-CoA synthase